MHLSHYFIATALTVTSITFLYSFESTNDIESKTTWEEQLKQIDIELRDLVIQVHSLRKKSLNNEVEGQPLLQQGLSGKEFVEKIEEAEQEKNQAAALENKIRELLRRRQELLQNNLPIIDGQ